MYCNNCGAPNDNGTRFCSSCGAPLEAPKYQQQYQQPYQQPMYYQPAKAQQPAQNFAIASLVLGIVSLIMFAIIAGPLGIIFGAIAKNKGNTSPMATAGIICGIIGVVSWFFIMVFMSEFMFAFF